MSSKEEQLLELLKTQDFDVNEVTNLIPRCNLSYTNKSKRNCLHILAKAKPCDKQLIAAKAICDLLIARRNVSCLYAEERINPLNLAARKKFNNESEQKIIVGLVRLLLKTDKRLSKKYSDGNSPLEISLIECATCGGNLRLVEFLEDRYFRKYGRKLSDLRVFAGCSLPQVAASKGHVLLLKWFNTENARQYIPLNLVDNDGETGLFDAASAGHDEAVRYLIECGDCDKDHRGRLGDTPLFRALRNDRFKTARLLLDLGADAKLRDYAGNSALHVTFQGPESSGRRKKSQLPPDGKDNLIDEYSEALEKLQHDLLSTENLAGYSPLHSCVESKNWKGLRAAQKWLGQEFDSALVNSSELNILHVFFSFHSGKEDTETLANILGSELWTKLLQSRTATGSGGCDRAGYNCLHFACDFNNSGAFRYLIHDVGLKLSDRTATGKSAVDLLLQHCDFEDVKQHYGVENSQEGPLSTEDQLHLCSLIDPMRAACALPLQESPHEQLAKKLLSVCADEKDRGELLRFFATSLRSFKSGRVSLARAGKKSTEVPLGVKLLLRCINEDDSVSVQHLAILGLLDNMWDAEFTCEVINELNECDKAMKKHGNTIALKHLKCKCKCKCKCGKACKECGKCKCGKACKECVECECANEPDQSKKRSACKCRPSDLVELCLLHGRYRVCLELLRCRQFDLVPACLRVILKCQAELADTTDRGKRDTLQQHRNSAQQILLNALNCLDDQVSTQDAKLVKRYLDGKIEGGPRFNAFRMKCKCGNECKDDNPDDELSIVQLLDQLDSEEVFATSCVRRFVYSSWNGGSLPCATHTKDNAFKYQLPRQQQEELEPGPTVNIELQQKQPESSQSGKRACRGTWSLNAKFLLHILMYFVYTVCFTVFITMGETCHSLKTTTGRALYTILCLYTVDFIVTQAADLASFDFSASRRVASSLRWAVTSLGPLFQLAGLIGVPIAEFAPQFAGSFPIRYGVHMCLATAYLLMCGRWLTLFKWFKWFGPTVGIIEKLLLKDLLPFLLIFLVFIVAFGVFFQVLLFPGRQAFTFGTDSALPVDVQEVIVNIYSRPLLLTFGEIEMDSLRQCGKGQNCSSLASTDCACPYKEGARLYLALFGFIFMILNLALLNLLIAKFNLTVNEGTKRAFATWSFNRFRMLRRFRHLPPAPPPLCWLSGLILWCVRKRYAKTENSESAGWWRTAISVSNQQQAPLTLPAEYREFLWFQAQKFRGKRADFLRPAPFPADQKLP